MVLVAGIFATIVCTAVSGMVPVWMQVDPAVRELTGTYFFILYLPMLFRSASILFGTVLRAAGDTKTPMRVGIIVNCINIVLNFLLIYDTRTVSLLGLRLVIPGAGWGVIGAAAASVLPLRLVSALSVGLYGMFLAIIVPPARESRVVRGLVLLSFAASFIAGRWALLSGVSSGVRTIFLTVAISLGAAVLFPIKDPEGAEEQA